LRLCASAPFQAWRRYRAIVARTSCAGASGPRVEFTVITLWDSVGAIQAFAGADAEAAVVPPEALALLASHDDRAVHWDVALDNSLMRGAK
jgi:hypothetical protein